MRDEGASAILYVIQPRSLSCGANDRDCNEVRYLHEALDLLGKAFCATPIAKTLHLFWWSALLPLEAGEGNAG